MVFLVCNLITNLKWNKLMLHLYSVLLLLLKEDNSMFFSPISPSVLDTLGPSHAGFLWLSRVVQHAILMFAATRALQTQG